MYDWRNRIDRLITREGIDSAYDALIEGVRNGEGAAALCLAEWRMTGHQIRRDLTEARRLYGIAAESLEEARSPYLALLANGAGGCERAWQQALHELYEARTEDEARQRALICAMDIDEVGNPTGPFEFERPIPSAHISVFKSFLGDDECEYLQAIARPRLQRAMVVDPKTGQLIYDPVRKSSFTSFPFVDENPAIHALNRRIAAATATTYEQGEPLQILSYAHGDEYKLHSDALPQSANQRTSTFLVYLNDDYVGGETDFPNLDFKFKGSPGDAIWFENADQYGRPMAITNHRGSKVISGTKMIASKWIRARPLDLSGPPGRPF